MSNKDAFWCEKKILQYVEQGNNKPVCFFLMKEKVGETFAGSHSHDLYEMMYITEGALEYSVKNKHYQLHKGDLVLIPPKTLHCAKDMPYEHSKRVVINFNKQAIENTIHTKCNLLEAFENVENNGHIVHMDSIFGKILQSILIRMQGSYLSSEYGDDLVFNISFCEALLLVNRRVKGMPTSGTGLLLDDTPFSRIVNYIDNNFTKNMSLDIIAEAVNLSPSRVSHVFKQETNMTVMQYVMQRRLNYAKELIHLGEKLVRIWMLCGFNDHISLLRWFKKEFGVTPSAYRKNYLANAHLEIEQTSTTNAIK